MASTKSTSHSIKKPKKIKVDVNGEVKFASLRKDGRYRVQINVEVLNYKDDGTPIYKYKYIYGYDSLELQNKIVQYYNLNGDEKRLKTLFTVDIKEWLITSFWKEVKNSTFDRYEQVLNYQIIPEAQKLSHKKITEITIDDCKIILKNIGASKSESTRKKAKILLRAYFDARIEDGIVSRNPARYKDHGSSYKKDAESEFSIDDKPVYLEDDEIERIKSVIENGYDIEVKSRSDNLFDAHNTIRQGEFFIFMLNTGLRVGEAVALKYSDIDFDKHLMTVRRNVTYSKKRNEKGESLKGYNREVLSPKTAKSADTIQINQKSIDILKSMLSKEPEGYNGYIVHDTRKISDDNNSKNYINPNALYKRWQTVCKYANVKPRGLHCLRHTCASHLFAVTNGNAVLVSELLRHTDVTFTEKIYIDIIKKYRNKIFEEFEI